MKITSFNNRFKKMK